MLHLYAFKRVLTFSKLLLKKLGENSMFTRCESRQKAFRFSHCFPSLRKACKCTPQHYKPRGKAFRERPQIQNAKCHHWLIYENEVFSLQEPGTKQNDNSPGGCEPWDVALGHVWLFITLGLKSEWYQSCCLRGCWLNINDPFWASIGLLLPSDLIVLLF